ncbi:MAG: hypothetical protein R3A79_25925 [Nannocystaceae bacterium]
MSRARLALVALLPALTLALACGGSPGEPPAPAPTKDGVGEPAKPADNEEGASFASPPESEPAPSPGPTDSGDPALDARIKEKHGQSCRFARACGEALIGVDCNAAADGPYYYLRRADLEIVATCGGACMAGDCKACPPKEWTCGPDYYEE